MSDSASPSTSSAPPLPYARTVALVRWLLYCCFVVIAYLILRRLGPILFPVVAAAGVAYLLDGAVDSLCEYGLKRTTVVAALLIGFLLALSGLVLVAIPTISEELMHLAAEMPAMVSRFGVWAQNALGIELPASWSAYLDSAHFGEVVKGAAGPAAALTAAAVGGLLAVLSFLAELLLVPVFAFYFLVGWDDMVHEAHLLVPPRHRDLVADIVTEIDAAVSTWVRGQLIVTTILGACYALTFRLLGVPMGFTIGVLVGLLTVIPFLGTVVGAMITLGMILLNYSGPGMLIGVAITFVVLHLAETAVLTPKLVGKKVGLGEVGALFAVLAGGKLLGFTGVLLAVPLAASIAVLLRRTLGYYRETKFFSHL